jgi:hypothetical protein
MSMASIVIELRTGPDWVLIGFSRKVSQGTWGGLRTLAMLAALILPASLALADRKPDAAERMRIEQVLRAKGYSAWGDIEIESQDRIWEIDGARGRNGRRYDLKIDAQTLQVLERTPD